MVVDNQRLFMLLLLRSWNHLLVGEPQYVEETSASPLLPTLFFHGGFWAIRIFWEASAGLRSRDLLSQDSRLAKQSPVRHAPFNQKASANHFRIQLVDWLVLIGVSVSEQRTVCQS